MKFDTLTVRGGQNPEPVTGAISTPIFQTATYVLEEPGRDKGFDYARSATPTRRILERNLSLLEGGAGAVCFSSGLSAVDALLHTLKKGDHVLCCDDLYGGTSRLFNKILSKGGIEFEYIDMTDPAAVGEHIRDNTRFVFIETPTNPMLKLIDIESVSEICRGAGVPLAVDNTFMTPCFQKPFELGADIVIHSLTKYLSGHNDVLGGAIICRDDELYEEMSRMVTAVGSTLGPMDSWLALRGIKTLALRMERHNASAVKIAEFLENHVAVKKVIYPGLVSHPQYDLARKQMTGFGGMISFEAAGCMERVRAFVKNVGLWLLAESLGGVESLITHPVSMTHGEVPQEQREKLGITAGLIRLSVGIENVDDLMEDLDRALNADL